MRSGWLASCVALGVFASLVASCGHPQNLEREESLNDPVTGSLRPTDRAFFKGDPAAQISCRGDAQCPIGALCDSGKRVCFSSSPQMRLTKIERACPLVPLYFPVDSSKLVPQAQHWVGHDAACLKSRGAKQVVLKGYADDRGDPAYNAELSRQRAEAVKEALSQHGTTIDVAVVGEGESDPVLRGHSEHDLAYNRRVELSPAQ